MTTTRIFYCTICPYPEEALSVVKRVYDYVDEVIVIHQYPLSEHVKSEFEALNTHLYHTQWNEDFSWYRTQYIKRTGEIISTSEKGYDKNDTWMLITDCDEFPSISMLNNLKKQITKANLQNSTIITWNSHDVFIHGEGTATPFTFIPRPLEDVDKNEVMSNVTSNYFKELLVKYQDRLEYRGKVHHTLCGSGLRIMQAPKEFYYDHIKTDGDLHAHGVRNYWTGGGGVQEMGSKWKEMKQIASKYGIETWEQMNRAIKIGNVPSDLKQFWIDHRNDNERNVDSELRSFYSYYFILHPDELKNIKIDNKNDVDQKIKSIITKEGIKDPLPAEGSDDEIERFVESEYIRILGRNGDPSGVANYTKIIKEGRIKKEYLSKIFRSSKEYKDKGLIS